MHSVSPGFTESSQKLFPARNFCASNLAESLAINDDSIAGGKSQKGTPKSILSQSPRVTKNHKTTLRPRESHIQPPRVAQESKLAFTIRPSARQYDEIAFLPLKPVHRGYRHLPEPTGSCSF